MQMLLSPVAGPVPPTKPITVWDIDLPEINVERPHHMAWWEYKERGTVRSSVLKELQFNLNP